MKVDWNSGAAAGRGRPECSQIQSFTAFGGVGGGGWEGWWEGRGVGAGGGGTHDDWNLNGVGHDGDSLCAWF